MTTINYQHMTAINCQLTLDRRRRQTKYRYTVRYTYIVRYRVHILFSFYVTTKTINALKNQQTNIW